MSSPRDALSRTSLVGSRIGRYDMVAEIGTGGMASVYLARSTGSAGFQRLVAIKVMHRHLSSDEAFVEMFLDEARVASTIHHPNVVAIMDVGLEDDLIFLIMEYVEGDSFSNVERVAVNLRRRIPLKIILRVALDSLAGLHNAHELTDHDDQHLKIIHRDVSPQNIMVGVDGTSRIVDFGIAKAESRITTTKVGMIKGKLNFMAPEQLRGGAVDRRVDIFGMGVTIWEAVTLRRLYSGDNDVDTARKIMSGEYPRLLDVDPTLPPVLDDVVRKSLAASPDDRYRTAAEFADAIESHLGNQIASHREVAAFMAGVAAQKIERERRAVREFSGAAAVHAPVAAAPEPDVSFDEDEEDVGGATVVESPGARLAAMRAAAAAPQPAAPRAPARRPTMASIRSVQPTVPAAPQAGREGAYDDDNETALITRGKAGQMAAAIQPLTRRNTTGSNPIAPGARATPDPRPSMPGARNSLPGASAGSRPGPGGPARDPLGVPDLPGGHGDLGVSGDPEPTQAIDLIRRSNRPPPPDATDPGQPSFPELPPIAAPPQVAMPLGPSPDMAAPALYGMAPPPPVQPVVQARAVRSGKGLLWALLGISLLCSLSALAWFITHP